MPPRSRAAAHSPIDVEAVRRKLAEGKIVRVGITRSAQFPEGGTGRVRHVGDPDVDGDEFVQVEVTLNGTRDVLPFTPADLTPATRGRPPGSGKAVPTGGSEQKAPAAGAGRAARPPAAPRAPSAGRATTAPANNRQASSTTSTTGVPAHPGGRDPVTAASAPFVPAGPGNSGSGPAASATFVPAGPGNAVPVAAAMAPSALEGPDAASRSASPATGSATTPPPPADGRARGSNEPAAPRARNGRGARRSPAVAITIATTDADPTQWRIEARVGAKVALRAGSVSPSRVWELVRLLDNDALSRAVSAILDEQREAAQARADTLAAELALVRAELADLPKGTH